MVISSKKELDNFIEIVNPDDTMVKQTKAVPILTLWKNKVLVGVIAPAGIKRQKLGKIIRQIMPGFEHINGAKVNYGEYYVLIRRQKISIEKE